MSPRYEGKPTPSPAFSRSPGSDGEVKGPEMGVAVSKMLDALPDATLEVRTRYTCGRATRAALAAVAGSAR